MSPEIASAQLRLDAAVRELQLAGEALVRAAKAQAGLRHQWPPAVAAIVRVVCDHCNLSPAQIEKRSQARAISLPRQVAMVLIRELTTAKLSEIGRYFGKEHETVIHATHAISARRDTEPAFAAEYAELKAVCIAALGGI